MEWETFEPKRWRGKNLISWHSGSKKFKRGSKIGLEEKGKRERKKRRERGKGYRKIEKDKKKIRKGRREVKYSWKKTEK